MVEEVGVVAKILIVITYDVVLASCCQGGVASPGKTLILSNHIHYKSDESFEVTENKVLLEILANL